MSKYILIIALFLTGCVHNTDDEDDLRTVPVTNNPHIVPSHGSGFPMIGGG